MRSRDDPQHISMLETASMASGDESDGAVSLAYLSATHNSPSDVSSVHNYYTTPAQRDCEYYYDDDNGAGGDTRRSDREQHSKRSSLSSLRFTGTDIGVDSAPSLFTREHVALLVNVAAVGAIHGLFETLAYPFFKRYLNMDEYQAYSAERWIALPWLSKLALAIVADALPIRASRCKAYIFAGWTCCALFALIALVLPAPAPYATGPGHVENSDAAASGAKYVALLTLATLGYVLVDTVCAGAMVRLAHSGRHPSAANARHVVTTLCTARFSARMVATFIVAMVCNSAAYGGSFGAGGSVRTVVALALALSVVALGVTWRAFVDSDAESDPALESKDDSACSMKQRIATTTAALYRVAHKRAVWQVAAFALVARTAASYYATPMKGVYGVWLDVSPLASNVGSAIDCGVFAAVALLFQRSHVLHTLRWRTVVAAATLGASAILLVSALFTVFGVVRSAFLTLVAEQLMASGDALVYVVVLFAVVHVAAEPGLEASVYNGVLAAANLSVPLAVSLSQSIGAHFDVYDHEYVQDTAHARAQAMYCVLVAVALKVASLAALPLLPQSAKHTCDMKALGGTARVGAIALSVGACVLGLWALLTVLLASFERTACLTVAGGEGC